MECRCAAAARSKTFPEAAQQILVEYARRYSSAGSMEGLSIPHCKSWVGPSREKACAGSARGWTRDETAGALERAGRTGSFPRFVQSHLSSVAVVPWTFVLARAPRNAQCCDRCLALCEDIFVS